MTPWRIKFCSIFTKHKGTAKKLDSSIGPWLHPEYTMSKGACDVTSVVQIWDSKSNWTTDFEFLVPPKTRRYFLMFTRQKPAPSVASNFGKDLQSFVTELNAIKSWSRRRRIFSLWTTPAEKESSECCKRWVGILVKRFQRFSSTFRLQHESPSQDMIFLDTKATTGFRTWPVGIEARVLTLQLTSESPML